MRRRLWRKTRLAYLRAKHRDLYARFMQGGGLAHNLTWDEWVRLDRWMRLCWRYRER